VECAFASFGRLCALDASNIASQRIFACGDGSGALYILTPEGLQENEEFSASVAIGTDATEANVLSSGTEAEEEIHNNNDNEDQLIQEPHDILAFQSLINALSF